MADSAVPFPWPEGKRAAISITFDDARPSQLDSGCPILDAFGAKATFYASIPALRNRAAGWRAAAESGHEIGNHTLTHPCSGNFAFARANALEDYTLQRMEAEITEASEAIEEVVGVVPATFAYPCGQKHVGRGIGAQSYVPLVAAQFLAGRGWMDERHNAPDFCDMAQLYGCELDGRSFPGIRHLVDHALAETGWLVLAGHDVGDGGPQTVLKETLHDLCGFASDPANGIWIDTVERIARYIAEQRDRNLGARPHG